MAATSSRVSLAIRVTRPVTEADLKVPNSPVGTNLTPKDTSRDSGSNGDKATGELVRTLMENVRLRGFCTWADGSFLTPALGTEDEAPWVDVEGSNGTQKFIEFLGEFNLSSALSSGQKDALKTFHEDPRFYVFSLTSQYVNEEYVGGPSPGDSNETPLTPQKGNKSARATPSKGKTNSKSPRKGESPRPTPVDPILEANRQHEEALKAELDAIQLPILRKPEKYAHVTADSLPIRPTSFVSVDCSHFLCTGGTTIVHRKITSDLSLEVRLTIEKPILSRQQRLVYRPLAFRFKHLSAYPVYSSESYEDAVQETILYGRIKMNHGIEREVILHPSQVKSVMNGTMRGEASSTSAALDETNSLADSLPLPLGSTLNSTMSNGMPWDRTTGKNIVKHSIDSVVSFLPGLEDLSQFDELLATETLQVIVLDDKLLSICFDDRHGAQFVKLLEATPAGSAALTAAASTAAAASLAGRTTAGTSGEKKSTPAKGKAAASPAKKSARGAASTPTSPGQITLSLLAIDNVDRFLIERLFTELRRSRDVCPHGTCRWRLEQLLGKSRDILSKLSSATSSTDEPNDRVIVTEDIITEVRFEKAKKPDRWTIPEDLSLKSALSIAKKQSQLAQISTTDTKLLGKTGMKNESTSQIRRAELYLTSGTTLSLTVSYERQRDESIIPFDSDKAVEPPVPRSMRPTFADTRSLRQSLTESTNSDARRPQLNSIERQEQRQFLAQEELNERLKVSPFTRAVVIFPYDDDNLLRQLNSAFEEINTAALLPFQGSLRSYTLSPEQQSSMKNGQLDALSGVMILDDHYRLVILEGLAGRNHAMEWLFMDFLARKGLNDDDQLTILCDPTVLFSERLYPQWCPDMGRIRIRGSLQDLVLKPELGDRQQVTELCSSSIENLMSLRRAPTLGIACKLRCFPIYEGLREVEILYGEAISRRDMDGSNQEEFIRTYKARDELRESQKLTLSPSRKALVFRETKPTSASTDNLGTSKQKMTLRPSTDTRNIAFEDHLRSRAEAGESGKHDFIEENRELRRRAWREMLVRREERDRKYAEVVERVTSSETWKKATLSSSGASGPPRIHLYSTQSLNFKELAWNEMRSRISDDRNATYTFSPDFVSQTVCVVNDKEEKEQRIAEERAARLTPKGFVYPKPKTRSELLTHPKRPTDARIEELTTPFVDSLDVLTQNADTKLTPREAAKLHQRELDFRSQTRHVEYFGALQPPEFEKPFDLRDLGGRDRLPRGVQTNTRKLDPDFFRSVHIGGEAQAKLLASAAAEEKRKWEEQVVVDSTSFKVGGFRVRDVPIAVDRYNDILHDPPARVALKKLRDTHTSRGKFIGYQTTPLSILVSEDYVPPPASPSLAAQKPDRTKFVTTTINPSTGDFQPGQDFTTYVNPQAMQPRINTVLAKKKHQPLRHNGLPPPAY